MQQSYNIVDSNNFSYNQFVFLGVMSESDRRLTHSVEPEAKRIQGNLSQQVEHVGMSNVAR